MLFRRIPEAHLLIGILLGAKYLFLESRVNFYSYDDCEGFDATVDILMKTIYPLI